jgi:hypothetical protein
VAGVTCIPSILDGKTIPEWPDFGIEKLPPGEPLTKAGQDYWTYWRASTDTHRPGTPVFSIAICVADATEEEARELLGARLRQVYERAHPDGCPGSH